MSFCGGMRTSLRMGPAEGGEDGRCSAFGGCGMCWAGLWILYRAVFGGKFCRVRIAEICNLMSF